MFSNIVVRLIHLVPFQHRLVVALMVFGLAIGSTIALFTSWVAIPICIVVVPIVCWGLAVVNFWGWLYYTVETWGEKK